MSDGRPPRFTVILPTHDRAELLPRAIRSVLDQSFRDLELLVIDDASSDDTASVVAKFQDPRIRRVWRSVNGGAGAARNTGLKQARGELLALLDDDDEYLPEFLKETDQAHRNLGPEVGLTWCGVRWLQDTPHGERLLKDEIWHPRFQDRKHAYLSFLENRRVGTNCGLAFRRSVFDTIGLFDEDLRGGAEDTDFLIRLVYHFDFGVIDRILVKVHLHPGANLRSSGVEKARDYVRIMQKHRPALEQDQRLWASLHYKTGWLCYHGGERLTGRKHILRAIRKYPFHFKSWAALVLFEFLGRYAPATHRAISTIRHQIIRRRRHPSNHPN